MTAAEIPPEATYVCTEKQAARVVGVPRRGFVDWAAERGLAPVAYADRWGPLWDHGQLVDGHGPGGKPTSATHVCAAGPAAALIGISRPNLDKWLAERGVVPVAYADHPVNRLYAYADLAEARDQWLGERDREADEKRRVAALANVQGGGGA